jgi:hypothetical protein
MELEHSNIAFNAEICGATDNIIGPDHHDPRGRGSKDRVLIRLERQTRLRIAIVQFGVWYTQSDSPTNHGRMFSVEYEQECSTAYIKVAHEHSLICIVVSATSTGLDSTDILSPSFRYDSAKPKLSS